MFALDIRSIALFRQLLVCVGLWDLLSRARFISEFYTQDGLWPRVFAISQTEKWSLHFISDSLTFQIFLFVIHATALFLLWSGWKPKWCSLIVWILTLSLHARNELINDGGDAVYRHLLFWSILLPSDAHFKTLVFEKTKRIQYRFTHLSTIGLFWLAISIYTFSGYSKVISPLWSHKIGLMNGLWAEWYVSSIGQWFRGMHFSVLQFFNDFVIFLELLFVWLLLIPDAFETAGKKTNLLFSQLRLLVVLSFMGLHLGIIVLFTLGSFPYFCIVMWSVFLPSLFWEWGGWEKIKGIMKFILPSPTELNQNSLDLLSINKRGFYFFSSKENPYEKRFDFISQCIATYSIVIGILWNLATVNPFVFKNPQWARVSTIQLGMEQGWNLFVRPEATLAWLSMIGKFEDGTIKELGYLKDASSVKVKPKLLSDLYPTYKWREIDYRYMWGHYDQMRIPLSIYYCKKYPGLSSFMITQYLLPISSQVESKFGTQTERPRGEWECRIGNLDKDRKDILAFKAIQK